MTLEVLQNYRQIDAARRELQDKGLSALDSLPRSLLRRLKLVRGVRVGDRLKSWDVLETLKFIEQQLDRQDPILDIGSYSSEIIVALHKSGYRRLTGVDLNPGLKSMPFADSIHYEVGNFLKVPAADGSFKAITAISVIEHGFDGPALCREMSRLLMKGGYLIVSFDYWPDKVDTSGIRIFDMTWTLFSKQDVLGFIKEAGRHGLVPTGDLRFDAQEAPIAFGGKRYTFAWLTLKKTNPS